MKLGFFLVSVFFFACFADAFQTRADDAGVLPKNRWRLRFVSSFSFADQAFDSSGSSINLGDQYSQTLSMGFLAAVRPEAQELMKSLNSVQAGLGDELPVAVIDTEINSSVVANAFVLEYGLTDRLSLGLILPFVYGEVNVKAKSTPSTEFEALMANFPEGHPMRAALSSVQRQMSAEALSRTLESDLGYDGGLSSWSGAGFGDLELGLKYNYLRSHPLKASTKAGLRLPTGRRDDPDQLFDVAFGDGQVDIGAFHYLDYTAHSRFYMTLETGYTLQLPHVATYRVPVMEGTRITPASAKLTHNPGDILESGLEANWKFARTMTLSPKYRYAKKFRDSYSSVDGMNTSVMADGSDQERHEAMLTLSYSTIPDVRAGRARFPFEASAFYRAPFAGENIERLQSAGIQLKSYF